MIVAIKTQLKHRAIRNLKPEKIQAGLDSNLWLCDTGVSL